MKIWCIWFQEERDGYIWLEAAWTDNQTAENHDSWKVEVDRCRRLAYEGDYEMRIQAVSIPDVHKLFEIPEVVAS